MEVSYKVNVGPGKTVEMMGSVDALDKITMQMRTHDGLLQACELALINFQELSQPNSQHKQAMALLTAAIQSTTPA